MFITPSQGYEWNGNYSGDIVRQGWASRREETDMLSPCMVQLRARARHRLG